MKPVQFAVVDRRALLLALAPVLLAGCSMFGKAASTADEKTAAKPTPQLISQPGKKTVVVHQLAGYLLASKFVANAIQLDVGLGHYDENMRYRGLKRDCVDANVHWYTTSHLELVLNTRIEAVNWFHDPTGAYALLQVHYRL